MPNYFRYAHNGDIFCVDDAVETFALHLGTTEAKGGGSWYARAKFGKDLCAIVIARGFASGEEEGRIGWNGDGASVAELQLAHDVFARHPFVVCHRCKDGTEYAYLKRMMRRY